MATTDVMTWGLLTIEGVEKDNGGLEGPFWEALSPNFELIT